MPLLFLSITLAFILGYTAHRTGICTVAAVGELMSTRRARMFLSFLKTILWVLVVYTFLMLWMPDIARSWRYYPVSVFAVIGGLVFGIGAAINNGCSFSTISKLAQGNLHVALTLPAFVLGVFAETSLMAMWPMPDVPAFNADMSTTPEVHWLLLVLLFAFAVREVFIIALPVFRDGNLGNAINARRYRLSTGAALIGISSGLLYALHGKWAYSSLVVQLFTGHQIENAVRKDIGMYLFAALLTGAVVSALSSREFRFSFAGEQWFRNLAGGFLMGFGAMLVPGGNAALILHDLPQLSLHAVTAYLAMIAGIALVMIIMKKITGKAMAVNCSGDICKIEK